MKHKSFYTGVGSIVAVLIIAAVAVLISVTASTVGIANIKGSAHGNYSRQITSGIDGCLEEALFALSVDDQYVGGAIHAGNVECTVVVTGAGAFRTVEVTGTRTAGARTYTRTINAQVDISVPGFRIVQWEE